MQKLQGFVEGGNTTLTISGAAGTISRRVQGSFPSATITVYAAGTTNLSTIYSDNGVTLKANPFVASADGTWFFYAANAKYDVKFSGGGIASPFTLGDFELLDGVGGTENGIFKRLNGEPVMGAGWASTNAMLSDLGSNVGAVMVPYGSGGGNPTTGKFGQVVVNMNGAAINQGGFTLMQNVPATETYAAGAVDQALYVIQHSSPVGPGVGSQAVINGIQIYSTPVAHTRVPYNLLHMQGEFLAGSAQTVIDENSIFYGELRTNAAAFAGTLFGGALHVGKGAATVDAPIVGLQLSVTKAPALAANKCLGLNVIAASDFGYAGTQCGSAIRCEGTPGWQYFLDCFSTAGSRLAAINGNGLFLAGDGTAALPGWSWQSEADSGWYRVSSQTFAFVVTAGEVIRMTPNTFRFSRSIEYGSPLTTANLTGNVNDYNPANLATARIVRINPNGAARNITGIAAQSDGHAIIIENISQVGGENLLLTHLDAGSAAANQFFCPGGASVTIRAGGAVEIFYDVTMTKWRPLTI